MSVMLSSINYVYTTLMQWIWASVRVKPHRACENDKTIYNEIFKVNFLMNLIYSSLSYTYIHTYIHKYTHSHIHAFLREHTNTHTYTQTGSSERLELTFVYRFNTFAFSSYFELISRKIHNFSLLRHVYLFVT
jgi:uncharacterized metal-binding protein